MWPASPSSWRTIRTRAKTAPAAILDLPDTTIRFVSGASRSNAFEPGIDRDGVAKSASRVSTCCPVPDLQARRLPTSDLQGATLPPGAVGAIRKSNGALRLHRALVIKSGDFHQQRLQFLIIIVLGHLAF